LELVLSIPPSYWVGGTTFLVFLGSLEKRFNMVGRIRTERAELAAKRATSRAEAREAEVREAEAQQTLIALRERERQEQSEDEERLLEGLVPGQRQFELETGIVEPNDE
jgi:hypothetical protein